MPFPLGSASAWCHPCGDLGATPMKVWVPSPRGSGLCHPQGSQSVTPVRLWLVSPPRVSGCHPCHTLFCVTPKGPWFVSPPSGSGWCHSQGSLAPPRAPQPCDKRGQRHPRQVLRALGLLLVAAGHSQPCGFVPVPRTRTLGSPSPSPRSPRGSPRTLHPSRAPGGHPDGPGHSW